MFTGTDAVIREPEFFYWKILPAEHTYKHICTFTCVYIFFHLQNMNMSHLWSMLSYCVKSSSQCERSCFQSNAEFFVFFLFNHQAFNVSLNHQKVYLRWKLTFSHIKKINPWVDRHPTGEKAWAASCFLAQALNYRVSMKASEAPRSR